MATSPLFLDSGLRGHATLGYEDCYAARIMRRFPRTACLSEYPYGVPLMALEKEWYDRAEAIRTAILQLRDSL
jgi:hypothetical protein